MGWVVNATPLLLYPRKNTCTGDWVGPRASVDRCEESHPPLGFDRVLKCYSRHVISTILPSRLLLVSPLVSVQHH